MTHKKVWLSVRVLTIGRESSHRLCAILDLSLLVIQVLAVLCALAQPAYAYVDPGSGFVALQIISSSFAGVIFLLRKRLRRIIGKWRWLSKQKGEGSARE